MRLKALLFVLAISSLAAGALPSVTAQSITLRTYTKYIAGTVAQGLATSPKGGWVYVVGSTTERDYPVTDNAFDRTCGTDGSCNMFAGRFGPDYQADVVLTVLDAAGAIHYSTYIGGSGRDDNPRIAVEHDGAVWLAGGKTSTIFENAPAGCSGSTWIARFEFTLRRLEEFWCVNGVVTDIALDHDNHLWLVGTTSGGLTPRNAFQPTLAGQLDIFIAEVVSREPQLRTETYLGGRGLDIASGIAITPTGSIALVGSTNSPDFPLVRPIRSTPPPSVVRGDAIVVVMDRSGRFLQFSTQLGGSEDDRAEDVAVDALGNVYVAGSTRSADMEVTGTIDAACGNDRRCDGTLDAFLAKISATGALQASTYYGGSGVDFARSLAWRPNGQLVFVGGTQSADFPLVNAQGFRRWRPAVNFEHTFLSVFDDALTHVTRAAFVGDETYLPGVATLTVWNNYAYVSGQVTTLTGASAYGNYLTAIPLQ